MNKGCILARAPGGQMRGAATQAMRCHRRGAATKQMPARRRAPSGCGPQARWRCCSLLTCNPACSSLAPSQWAWGPAAKCNLYSFTGPNGSVQMNASLLQPMEKRAIITRMLYNLKGIYTQKDQYQMALSVIEKILMLNPSAPSEVRDRGLMYMQTSLFAKALADLESYLKNAVAPEDCSNIENHVKMLRKIVCANN